MQNDDSVMTRAITQAAATFSAEPSIQINGMPFPKSMVLAMDGGDAIWAEGQAQQRAQLAKAKVRADIKLKVGDTDSLLGTTADVSQITAAGMLALTAALGAGETFPKFRSAFMTSIEALIPKSDGADVYAQAEGFLASIQSGDVILTASIKGLPTVIAEMSDRSTGVAKVLMADADAQAE